MLKTVDLFAGAGGKNILCEPKTKAAFRTIILPTVMVELLREYKRGFFSPLMFPSRIKPDQPIDPGYVRKRRSHGSSAWMSALYENTAMRSARSWQLWRQHKSRQGLHRVLRLIKEKAQAVRSKTHRLQLQKWSRLSPVCGIIVVKRKITAKLAVIFHSWWTRRDSNPRPLGCEPNALPAELRAHIVRSGCCGHHYNSVFIQNQQAMRK